MGLEAGESLVWEPPVGAAGTRPEEQQDRRLSPRSTWGRCQVSYVSSGMCKDKSQSLGEYELHSNTSRLVGRRLGWKRESNETVAAL